MWYLLNLLTCCSQRPVIFRTSGKGSNGDGKGGNGSNSSNSSNSYTVTQDNPLIMEHSINLFL
jgi:hypothetical protein